MMSLRERDRASMAEVGMASRSTWLALIASASVVFVAVAGCSDDDDGGGAAGEAGSAGSAGAAGAATGGSGGTGGTFIGSGGSSGSTLEAGADGETCSFANLDFGAECNTCAKQKCCAEVAACDGKPDCVTLIECVAACPVDADAGTIDPTCIGTCAAATPVMNEYNPAVFCLGGADCGPACPF